MVASELLFIARAFTDILILLAVTVASLGSSLTWRPSEVFRVCL